MATRIDPSLVKGMVATKPDLDGMFSNAGNSVQMFERKVIAVKDIDVDGTGSTKFRLNLDDCNISKWISTD